MLVVTNSANISCVNTLATLPSEMRPIRSFSPTFEKISFPDSNVDLLRFAKTKGNVIGYCIVDNNETPTHCESQPGLTMGGLLIVTPKRVGIFYLAGSKFFTVYKSSEMRCDFSAISPLSYYSTYFSRVAMEKPANINLVVSNSETLILQEYTTTTKLAGFPRFKKAILSYGTPLAFYGTMTSELGWNFIPSTPSGGLMNFLNPFNSPSKYDRYNATADLGEWGVVTQKNPEAVAALRDFRAGRGFSAKWCREYQAAPTLFVQMTGYLQFATKYTEGLAYNIVGKRGFVDGFGIKEFVNGDSSLMYSYTESDELNIMLQKIQKRYEQLLSASVEEAYSSLRSTAENFNQKFGAIYQNYDTVDQQLFEQDALGRFSKGSTVLTGLTLKDSEVFNGKDKVATIQGHKIVCEQGIKYDTDSGFVSFPTANDYGFTGTELEIGGLPKITLPVCKYQRNTQGVGSAAQLAQDAAATFNSYIDYLDWSKSVFTPALDFEKLQKDVHSQVNTMVHAATDSIIANLSKLADYSKVPLSQVAVSVNRQHRVTCKKKHCFLETCSETHWMYATDWSPDDGMSGFINQRVYPTTKGEWVKGPKDPSFAIKAIGVRGWKKNTSVYDFDVTVRFVANPIAACALDLSESDRIKDSTSMISAMLAALGYKATIDAVGTTGNLLGSYDYHGHKKYYDNCRRVSKDWGNWITSGPNAYWGFEVRSPIIFEASFHCKTPYLEFKTANTKLSSYQIAVKTQYSEFVKQAAATAVGEFVNWFEGRDLGKGIFIFRTSDCLLTVRDSKLIGFNTVYSSDSFNQVLNQALQLPDPRIKNEASISESSKALSAETNGLGHEVRLALTELQKDLNAEVTAGSFWWNPNIGTVSRYEPRVLSLLWRYS